MNLLTRYDAAIEAGEIDNNPSQREILDHLQRLADELKKPRSWFSWGRKESIKGLYIYGPVGVGKTYLVDLFYQCLAENKKARFHFHHFMQQIDNQLRKLQGHKDPLKEIAKNIAQMDRILCFDEFLIHDVAYAMILAELLQALQAEGVILVITSNTAPNELYKNGVHRERFIPAITLIKNNCEILYLDVHKDYRLGRQPLLDAYLHPLCEKTAATMDKQFNLLRTQFKENDFVTIQNRDIPYLKSGDRVIWFAFEVLCNLPRSQLDYLEIAEQFDAVFVSNIPCLTTNHTAQAIMFIHFIDVMYDRGINVIISAAVPPEALYVAGEMKETFKRTLSRLMEMQSVDYQNNHPRREVQAII